MSKTYIAIFEEAKEGGYNVTFPDIFGGVTCGDSFEDAVFMAKDLLLIMLTSAKGQCFEPSSKEKMEKLFPDKKLVEISVEI
ncbi:MAG: type II toxin-antitoxin system HicB family antitoxin [Bacilli bacterium]|nr:type II toxin-antitoxin system HicB family antitoxin [Bacilli bacterium]